MVLAWSRQAYAVFLLADDNAGDIPRDEAVTLSRSLNDQALALQPDLVEAHVMASRLYADDYRYEDALASFQRAGTSPQARVSQAAAASMLGDTERAFEFLRDGIEAGYRNISAIRDNAHFDPIRADTRFEELLGGAD